MKTRDIVLTGAALLALSVPAFAQSQTGSTGSTGSTTPQTTTAEPGEIQQRKENQRDPIAQGVKDGQLTPGETAKLENQQQGINKEVTGMRQANGGKLTGADKKAVNQQQNQASKSIYAKKHNSITTSAAK